MYLTYVVYAVFIALFVWGGKFAGFKSSQFHEDSSSLAVTKSLRGLAAIGVILHHVSQEMIFQQAFGANKPGVISLFVNAGYLFVAVFFFWSGFGLVKSFESKENYLDGFMKKRVLKVLVVPFYVNVILYAVFLLIMKKEMPVAQWITNFTGLTLMNDYAWYPIVAAILYTAFYVLFNNVKNRGVCFAIIALIIVLQGLFFCVSGHFAWWAGDNNWWLSHSGWEKSHWWMGFKIFWFSGEWWVNSSPAFFIGLLFAHFESCIRKWFKSLYWLKLVILIAVYIGVSSLSMYGQEHFGYWTEFNGQGPGIANKMLTYIMQIPQSMILVILIFAVLLKYYASNPVTRFMGNLSLETYMMNLMAITAFHFLLYTNGENGVFTFIRSNGHANFIAMSLFLVAVICSSIILALIYKKLNYFAQKIVKD